MTLITSSASRLPTVRDWLILIEKVRGYPLPHTLTATSIAHCASLYNIHKASIRSNLRLVEYHNPWLSINADCRKYYAHVLLVRCQKGHDRTKTPRSLSPHMTMSVTACIQIGAANLSFLWRLVHAAKQCLLYRLYRTDAQSENPCKCPSKPLFLYNCRSSAVKVLLLLITVVINCSRQATTFPDSLRSTRRPRKTARHITVNGMSWRVHHLFKTSRIVRVGQELCFNPINILLFGLRAIRHSELGS